MKPSASLSGNLCFFLTDLHGREDRYHKLETLIVEQLPDYVLLGGDLLPHASHALVGFSFIRQVMFPVFEQLRTRLKDRYPVVLTILGNDDPRSEEIQMREGENKGLWHYIHHKSFQAGEYTVYGYSFIPPTPFRLKDWEKYDVSRFTDPGCIGPTEGKRTIEPDYDPEVDTIEHDLDVWLGAADLSKAVLLFHAPPYNTSLDRAALDGMSIDHVPLDVHVGSIALERFIRTKQPYLSLHGHVHESTRITGKWMERLGKTIAIQGAGEPPALSLVRFSLDEPGKATRKEV
jgi:Icc-related predicted phosphoesterase